MSLDEEWPVIARKVFSRKTVSAPPYLWTRILAGIEAEEQKRAGAWWLQWSFMRQVTAAVALFVLMGTGYVLLKSYQGIPIDLLVEGQTRPVNTIRLSMSHAPTRTEVTAWVLGGKPWEDD